MRLSLPLLLGLAAIKADAQRPTATIDSGVIIGTTTALPSSLSTVNQFLGVQFAKSPPVRFSPPEKPQSWSSPRNASTRSPACIQQIGYPTQESTNRIKLFFNTPAPAESEDCLYLNVFAPSKAPPSGGRAVMYWVHGGDLKFGNAGQPLYDGSNFAAYEDVIVVTANYRTNVFGFPAAPELPVQQRNVGFLDQRLGLDWVQRNIRAFGGDPAKVTIFGESAGAISLDALITSYSSSSARPFRAAILQSGHISYPFAPPPNVTAAWANLTTDLGCQGQGIACVRSKSASQIKSALETKRYEFDPIVDGVTVVSNPAQRRRSGNIANVPLLSGSNADEARVFLIGQNNITAYLANLFPGRPDRQQAVRSRYAIGQAPGLQTDFDIIAQIFTDINYQCPQARVANDSLTANIPTWRYYYDATFPNLQFGYDVRAWHNSENYLTFSTYPRTNATSQQVQLSNYMRAAWAKFAKDPTGGPGWVKFGSLSGGWNANDVAGLGINGGAGVTLMKQKDLDFRCDVYKSIYDEFGGAYEIGTGTF